MGYLVLEKFILADETIMWFTSFSTLKAAREHVKKSVNNIAEIYKKDIGFNDKVRYILIK